MTNLPFYLFSIVLNVQVPARLNAVRTGVTQQAMMRIYIACYIITFLKNYFGF